MLDEHYSASIDEEIASGRCRWASDLIRSARCLLEDRDTHLRSLRASLIDGERSGTPAPFDFGAFVARKRASAFR